MNGYCLPEPFFSAKVTIHTDIRSPSSARSAVPETRPSPSRVPVERVGGEVDENHAWSVTAAVGASRHHDECVGSHSSCRGEGHQEGDGSVRQQHHLCALPVPQPAGAASIHAHFGFYHYIYVCCACCARIMSSEVCPVGIKYRNCSSPLFPDCQHPGQPCCYSQQEVRERSLLYEYSKHRSAGAEVSMIVSEWIWFVDHSGLPPVTDSSDQLPEHRRSRVFLADQEFIFLMLWFSVWYLNLNARYIILVVLTRYPVPHVDGSTSCSHAQLAQCCVGFCVSAGCFLFPTGIAVASVATWRRWWWTCLDSTLKSRSSFKTVMIINLIIWFRVHCSDRLPRAR